MFRLDTHDSLNGFFFNVIWQLALQFHIYLEDTDLKDFRKAYILLFVNLCISIFKKIVKKSNWENIIL